MRIIGVTTILFVLLSTPLIAETLVSTGIVDLHRKVLDLVFKIQNLEGFVRDLPITETDTEVHIDLAADVLFDFDKADLRPQAQDSLKRAATVIRDKARGTVRIEGHTDNKGTSAYNQTLSDQRAQAVKNWLVTKEGLTSIEFRTAGFGAKKPIAPNAKPDGSEDPQGRQKNRRVEIIVEKTPK